jgi:hypothetical protein
MNMSHRSQAPVFALLLARGVVVGALGAIGLVASACGPARAPAQPTVSLRIGGTPSTATVIVDEEALGPLEFVAAHGVALPPGVHHVTVKASGYFPMDQVVDAQLGGAPVVVQVALVPVPD